MIQVDQLSVFKGQKCLLDQVSLSTQTGQKLAILGANGAGKSTLLKCLAGEETGYSGEIQFGQRSLPSIQPAERARCLAVMPQQATLAFPFRVAQVVALGRTPWQDEEKTQDWQEQAMALTDSVHLANRVFTDLSGGEQQRVQLARVLVQLWHRLKTESVLYEPAALLLDECTSALDPAHQHAIMAATEHFASAGVAVIAVMHDTALAASWADRILMLANGRVLAEGGSELLADPTLLVKAYQLPPELANRYAVTNEHWLRD
ncbi:MAG: heme ABC transporter ATP-binding protein [Oceanobacter sp.]